MTTEEIYLELVPLFPLVVEEATLVQLQPESLGLKIGTILPYPALASEIEQHDEETVSSPNGTNSSSNGRKAKATAMERMSGANSIPVITISSTSKNRKRDEESAARRRKCCETKKVLRGDDWRERMVVEIEHSLAASSEFGGGEDDDESTASSEDEEEEEESCFICQLGGKLMLCDFPGCAKVYHQMCLLSTCADPNLALNSEYEMDEVWFCPKHTCVSCGVLENTECSLSAVDLPRGLL
eukprot:gene24594-30960_t